jgi:hypothetical protein
MSEFVRAFMHTTPEAPYPDIEKGCGTCLHWKDREDDCGVCTWWPDNPAPFWTTGSFRGLLEKQEGKECEAYVARDPLPSDPGYSAWEEANIKRSHELTEWLNKNGYEGLDRVYSAFCTGLQEDLPKANPGLAYFKNIKNTDR